ncbi:hypothetical protein B4U80_00751 [Leptotrombidium deliense]|uniref:Uncharacterized protein n=1 Tax=Leptotrombidium deliense TaxID=299467 RepID=A0A443QZK0_9ACAR|nr:hypothetical protein B4U80_00751 [Leptotrombidium deliense]
MYSRTRTSCHQTAFQFLCQTNTLVIILNYMPTNSIYSNSFIGIILF